jgi:hypothetical protein
MFSAKTAAPEQFSAVLSLSQRVFPEQFYKLAP